MRRQQPTASQERFTPEFMQWLKQNKVTRRQIRRDPAALDQYHRDWLKATKKKPRTRRPSLLGLIPNLDMMDLGTVVENVQIARDLFKAYHNIKGKSIFQNNRSV